MSSNEFKLKINRADLAKIVDSSRQLRITDQDFIKQAPYEDVYAACILMSLQDFMKERRVNPDFELVLNE